MYGMFVNVGNSLEGKVYLLLYWISFNFMFKV